MWYHALNGNAPNNIAPFQLTEISFRGTFYNPTINTGTGFEDLIGPDVFDQGVDNDSADYDLSFVDSLNLPVAVEASNVTIPSTGPNTPTRAAVGWVGSGQSETDLQAAISAFTATNPNDTTDDNYLGTYFDGQGYPTYQVVDQGNVKLPSGQNLFLSSVASGSNSDIYFNMTFSDGTKISEPYPALSNGGIGPLTLLIGGDPAHPSQGQTLGLNTAAMANQYALTNFIEPNVAAGHTYDVTYVDNGVITSLGTITGIAMEGGTGRRRRHQRDRAQQCFHTKFTLSLWRIPTMRRRRSPASGTRGRTTTPRMCSRRRRTMFPARSPAATSSRSPIPPRDWSRAWR